MRHLRLPQFRTSYRLHTILVDSKRVNSRLFTGDCVESSKLTSFYCFSVFNHFVGRHLKISHENCVGLTNLKGILCLFCQFDRERGEDGEVPLSLHESPIGGLALNVGLSFRLRKSNFKPGTILHMPRLYATLLTKK